MTKKRIAIFAATKTGFEIAKLFFNRNYIVELLVLDSKEETSLKTKFLEFNNFKKVIEYQDLINFSEKSLQDYNLDLVLLAWWPFIIPKKLFAMSRKGFLNTHPSLLPYNRGKHYYFWNITEEHPFGITIHFINEKIDSGYIVFQKEISKNWCDTGCSLQKIAKKAMVDFVDDHIEDIVHCNLTKEKVIPDNTFLHFAKELDSASEIQLDKMYSGRSILNLIRARSGFPNGGAWFEDKDIKYEQDLTIRKSTIFDAEKKT